MLKNLIKIWNTINQNLANLVKKWCFQEMILKEDAGSWNEIYMQNVPIVVTNLFKNFGIYLTSGGGGFFYNDFEK